MFDDVDARSFPVVSQSGSAMYLNHLALITNNYLSVNSASITSSRRDAGWPVAAEGLLAASAFGDRRRPLGPSLAMRPH